MEIPKGKVSSLYRLSPMQEGMLFHNLYSPQSGMYIQQLSIDLNGSLNVRAFEESWKWLLEKHSILRTAFFHNNLKNPVQCVFEHCTLPLQLLDYSLHSPTEQQSVIKLFLENDLRTPFSLDQAPLMRMTLIRLSETRHRMIWTHHHILMDGWSSGLLTGEFVAAYHSYSSNQKPADQPVDHFEDYIKYINRVDGDKAREFWTSYFDRFDHQVALPFVSKNENEEYSPSEFENFSWDSVSSAQLVKYARKYHLTINTIVQGVWSLLLSRYISKTDVTLGVTTAGRPMDLMNAEKRIGLYINTLPIRVQLDVNETITSWLAGLQVQHSKAQGFQHSSLSDIQRWSGTQGALFDHILVFDSFPKLTLTESDPESMTLTYTGVKLSEKNSYALTIEASFGEQLDIGFLYDPKSIDPFFIGMIHKHFDFVLKQIISEQCVRVADLQLMDTASRDQVISLGTSRDRIEYRDTFIKSFEIQAEKNPDAIAVIHNHRKLTYKELDQQSTRLATVLQRSMSSAQELIPVIGDRSANWLAAMLAIFKSNAVYIPLHPEYPDERILGILSDCNASIVIASDEEIKKRRSWMDQFQKIIISSDSFTVVTGMSQLPLRGCTLPSPQLTDLAYVIYTSGSTGKPKGVMIEHAGMLNHLHAKVNDLEITSQSNIVQNASQTFDISIWQFLSALLVGGRITIIDQQILFDFQQFVNSIQDHGITLLELVPSYLNTILEETEGIDPGLNQLKHLVVTGERLQKSLVTKWFQRGYTPPLVNAYGPTEASDDITHLIINHDPEEPRIFLGNTIQNLGICILDHNFNPSPIGIPGEIGVYGIGVGRGYLNDPENTSDRFIRNPISDHGDILYRTGDLGKWTKEGKLDFLGRMDEQIKIRGYRIELGEIEVVLRSMSVIRDCAVIVATNETVNKTLLAFITVEPAYDYQTVDHYLRQYLPDYMVPAEFVVLPELPLTANGKIDKKRLRAMAPQPKNQLPSLQTPWEIKLATVWQELLERNDITREDHFFRTGGHSLKAIRLISRIQKEFNVRLNLKQVFESPTLSEMAITLSNSVKLEEMKISQLNAADSYELSHAQQRLWILNQIERTPGLYNISLTVSLEGQLDLNALTIAFECLIKKYEILRTIFITVNNQPRQQVRPFDDLSFVIGFHDLSESNNEASANNLISNFLSHDFDLSAAPLFRLMIIRKTENQFLLSFLVHHIITDGLSLGIFVDELMQYYAEVRQGKLPAITPPYIQYKDFAGWQNNLIRKGYFSRQGQYWKNRFADEIPVLNLPYDFISANQGDRKGDVIELSIPGKIVSELQQLAIDTRSSIFMVMVAAIKTLLYRYTQQEDIIVGITSTGRNHPDLDHQLGFFINTLPIRTVFKGGDSFKDLIQTVSSNILTAHDNQDYPYDLLITHLHQKKGRNTMPLFDVLVEYQNKENKPASIDGLTIQPFKTSSTISKFNLTFFITEQPDGSLSIELEYNTGLFVKDSIITLSNRLMNLLSSVIQTAAAPLHQLNILSDSEKVLLEQDGKGETVHYRNQTGLWADLERIFLKFPDRVALHFAGTTLTYGKINEESDRLCRVLIEQYNVNRNDLVPVFMKRSDQLIIALLAVWKAGAAFVPIDPSWPARRVEFVLHEINSTILITESEWLFQLGTHQHRIIALDLGIPSPGNGPDIIPMPVQGPDTAYIMYTSGSTGEPKGVEISMQALGNYIHWANNFYFKDETGHPFPFFTPLTFDLTLTSVFSTLTRGDELFIYDSDNSYENLKSIFANASIKAIKLTPSHLDLLSEFLTTDSEIKTFIVGGEPLKLHQIAFLQSSISNLIIYNEYGPTEATVGCTVEMIDSPVSMVSIGRAIFNTRIYILDNFLNPVPRGIEGEIYISGPCLAKGYYNRSSLTNERFIKNPSPEKEFTVIYKTGDIGRWMNNGNILLTGRKDDQVKVRGYRVETQEIENIMMKYPDVDKARIIVRNKISSPCLVAYYTSRNKLDKEYLHRYLEDYLPAYMIPAIFIRVDEFPLTVNGKIDTGKLEEITHVKSELKSPETNTESELVQLWESILEQQPIGVEDDFFELGGNSLKVISVVEQFNRKFPDALKVSDLFNQSTIREIAAIVDQRLSVVPKNNSIEIEEFEL